ncbi:MAG: hypothetical protein V7L11_18255 [Nostoc sp.]|uniref:hypothetical protein n=1 Tax=Nostoc sp. TaxID=1180 RepID=UPI002FF59ADF
MEFQPGQQVIWNYKSRRRHTYTHKVPAQIIKFSQKQVQIQVLKTTGESLRRWVHRDRLETFKIEWGDEGVGEIRERSFTPSAPLPLINAQCPMPYSQITTFPKT